jgi:hypothetical protein
VKIKISNPNDTFPSSLIDSQRESNVENNEKVRSSGHALWLLTLWKGRRVCWSFRMGLGRIDKLQSITRTYTKPTQSD